MTDVDPKAMAHLAVELLDALSPREREAVRATPAVEKWRTWSYLPGDRAGLPLESASSVVVDLVEQLVGAAHSEHGAALVAGAMEVERERRRLVTGQQPDSDRYWLQILGDPGRIPGDGVDDGVWGWRLNGHHVGVHVVVSGTSGRSRVTFTPHFIGSEPARLPEGPMAGRRLLGPEEDVARELVTGLRPAQREVALASDVAPADILTGMDPVADPGVLPSGIRRGDLDTGQRRVLDALVRRYLERVPTAYAEQCWQEMMDVGEGDVEFAWAGSTEVGGPHYYCVRMPAFLIEYDNTQDDANHAHSVWRHLRDDFGGDPLRAHLRSAHAPVE